MNRIILEKKEKSKKLNKEIDKSRKHSMETSDPLPTSTNILVTKITF